MSLSIRDTRVSEQSGWAVVLSALGWPARVFAARHAMSQLGQMNAHELKDIGLLPQDLYDVSALRLDADPTRILAERARERRRRR